MSVSDRSSCLRFRFRRMMPSREYMQDALSSTHRWQCDSSREQAIWIRQYSATMVNNIVASSRGPIAELNVRCSM